MIETPAEHFRLAKEALLAGRNVFVEKPLATKVAEVDELGNLAEARNLVVMAGHTFLYNEAVRYVKKLLDAGELGEIRYIYSQRLNLGRIRPDIDALWNFAPHDISIIQYWLGDPKPLSVHRLGMDFIQNGVDDVVFLSIVYPNKIIANIHVSWLDREGPKDDCSGFVKWSSMTISPTTRSPSTTRGSIRKPSSAKTWTLTTSARAVQLERRSPMPHVNFTAAAIGGRNLHRVHVQRKEADNRYTPREECRRHPRTGQALFSLFSNVKTVTLGQVC